VTGGGLLLEENEGALVVGVQHSMSTKESSKGTPSERMEVRQNLAMFAAIRCSPRARSEEKPVGISRSAISAIRD
jgi:hypothetical protein